MATNFASRETRGGPTAGNSAELVEQYARGLLAIVNAEGALERVEEELYRFAQALEANNDLREALSDRQIPVERRLAVVDELLGERADPQTVAAVGHVIASGRGRMLVDIVRAFTRAAASQRDRAVAEVRTAVELTDDQRERLRKALGEATGREVELKIIVDESVVGGVLATVGDTVIDGSVSRQLARMRARLAGASTTKDTT
jgi:F-type H+-transporting ATPase subunit delta